MSFENKYSKSLLEPIIVIIENPDKGVFSYELMKLYLTFF